LLADWATTQVVHDRYKEWLKADGEHPRHH